MKSPGDPNLKRAIAKLSAHGREQWTGYLTPVEFVALLDNGAQATGQFDEKASRERVANGESGARWYYFNAKAELRAAIIKALAGKPGVATSSSLAVRAARRKLK